MLKILKKIFLNQTSLAILCSLMRLALLLQNIMATYKTVLRINKGKTKIMHMNYHREAAPSKALEDLEVVEELKYLDARLASSLPDFPQQRGIVWSNFWKLQTIWRSTSLYCVKSVQIRSFFWPVFFCIRTRKNSVFGHFSRSVIVTPEAQIF